MKGMMPYPTRKHLLFFFTLLICVSTSLFSQEGINQVNASGKKQGIWKKYYPGGRLRYEGYFENDVPKGEFRHYHENGKIKAIIRHAGDGLRAEAELYNEEGQLTARGKYYKEQKDGQWIYVVPGKNLTSAVEYWKEGKPDGTWRIYFNTDTTLSEYWSYVDGKKHGPWRQFFKDGSPRLEANYQFDELNGSFKVFYPNGKVRAEGIYNNGLRWGEWKYFTEDGQLKRREWYEQGNVVKEEVLIPDPEEPDTPLDPSLDPEKSGENPF
ncbi:MAG: toxin-antitoxin system YwqK family antitoxin [Bacteroidales bacterium]|jgi:antitoxin component YwqK of YwqJK toxin-antitoxin module|nr:toxin-antitoxin system YwqK family antitoxin [Bacteroidales bacterium]